MNWALAAATGTQRAVARELSSARLAIMFIAQHERGTVTLLFVGDLRCRISGRILAPLAGDFP